MLNARRMMHLIRTSTLYDKNRCCRRISFESFKPYLLLSILFVLFPSSAFPASVPVFVSLSMSRTSLSFSLSLSHSLYLPLSPSLSAGDCISRGFSRGPCVPGGSLPGRHQKAKTTTRKKFQKKFLVHF